MPLGVKKGPLTENKEASDGTERGLYNDLILASIHHEHDSSSGHWNSQPDFSRGGSNSLGENRIHDLIRMR